MAEGKQSALRGKLKITAVLRVETGLHIGAANDFAPIGAVDSPFIRDPFTKKPIIPGSSIKGKMRTLLAKSMVPENQYFLNDIKDDPEVIKRLFGSAQDQAAQPARLQFFDLQMTPESFSQFDQMELDTYIGESKFENTINRLTAVANPRQIERVPAGAEFAFRLVYNVENTDELDADMETLLEGLQLLQWDYLGGHGSRGYGRISLHDYKVEAFSLNPKNRKALQEHAEDIREGLEGIDSL